MNFRELERCQGNAAKSSEDDIDHQDRVREAPQEEFPKRNVRSRGADPQNRRGSTFEAIYEVVRQIPRGKVATYGQIAELIGNKRMSRVVGYALHSNPDPEGIPCYRIVNRFGGVSPAFAFGGKNRQIELLEADGIPCPDGRVDLSVYQWKKRRV